MPRSHLDKSGGTLGNIETTVEHDTNSLTKNIPKSIILTIQQPHKIVRLASNAYLSPGSNGCNRRIFWEASRLGVPSLPLSSVFTDSDFSQYRTRFAGAFPFAFYTNDEDKNCE